MKQIRLVFYMLAIILITSTFGVGANEKSNEFVQKAKLLGFDNAVPLVGFKQYLNENDLQKSKKVLYCFVNYEKHYKLNQKLDNFLIYLFLPTERAPSESSIFTQIAISPRGQDVTKGATLRGYSFKLIDMVEVVGLDGFTKSIPFFERIIDDKDLKGYGKPPNDQVSTQLLIGTWTLDTNFLISTKQLSCTTIKYIFDSNFIVKTHNKSFSPNCSTSAESSSTWTVMNNFFIYDLNNQTGKFNLNKLKINDPGIGYKKIMKLTQDKLILFDHGRELKYKKN